MRVNYKSDNFFILSMLFLAIAAWIITAIIASTSCGPVIDAGDAIYQNAMEGKGCEPASFECWKNKLLICNASHEREVNLDCDAYETPRSCCAIGGLYSCYRPYECQEVHDDTAE